MSDHTTYIIRRELRSLGQAVGTLVALAIIIRLGLLAFEALYGFPFPTSY